MNFIKCIAAVGLIVGLLAASGAAEVKYTVTDLGNFNGGATYGMGLNALGTAAVGWADVPGGTTAMLWTAGGGVTDVGTFGGTQGYAFGVNNAGFVAGSATDSGGNLHAYVYYGGLKSDLGTLGHAISEASSINNSGHVVGYVADSNTSTDSWSAFLFKDGVMTDMNTLINPASGWVLKSANHINDAGQIVGEGTFGGQSKAYLYDDGTVTDLGNLGGTEAYAMGINAGGTLVVGSGETAEGVFRGFVWDSVNGIQALGTFGGEYSDAFAVNASGQIVGEADAASGAQLAFVYKNGVMTDLNTVIDPALGWQLQYAEDINDAGAIVGLGLIGGETHAFMLTPVPEPATMALLVLGAAGAWMRRRRPH